MSWSDVTDLFTNCVRRYKITVPRAKTGVAGTSDGWAQGEAPSFCGTGNFFHGTGKRVPWLKARRPETVSHNVI